MMDFYTGFLLFVLFALFVGLPSWGLYACWVWLHTDSKDRPARQGGSMSSAIGGAMLVVDKVICPSVEHRIETQSPIAEEDENDGD